jgi:membrane protein YqaA with SNARE-associated domain
MILIVLIAWLTTFLINIIPFFMPPTWTLLAFFRVRFDLPTWLLAPGGAVCATAGRCVLALLTRRFGARFLPAKEQANVRHLGMFLKRQRWSYAGILFYAFGPIPSPHLFIAAGLVGLDLRLVAGAFFTGRLVSYSALVAGTGAAADRLGPLFSRQFGGAFALIGPLTAAGMVLALVKIDWRSVLQRWMNGHDRPARETQP